MLRILKGAVIACVLAFLAASAGIFASLWTARNTAAPAIFLISGAIVYVLIFITGTKIISKLIKKGSPSHGGKVFYTVGGILIVALTIGLLMPLSDKHREPEAVAGQKFWDLTSGEKIAYVRINTGGKTSLPPVIFLHGGPGIPDMAGDAGYFGQLAAEGYEVYVYDEIGTGRSSRLKSPRDYTIQRDTDDLEIIRQKVGSEKIILIGHSYGCEVIANYMAAYGNRVEKAVFISPGAINPQDTSGGNLTSRLSSGQKRLLFGAMLNPRILMTYSLLQINPVAARNFAGDNEMDARFDIVYKYSQPAIHERTKPLGPELSGLGFYANQTPQSAAAEPKTDIRKALYGRNTPSLIIKASSDYLSWSSAIDYKKALTNSTLVYFQDAGHNVFRINRRAL